MQKWVLAICAAAGLWAGDVRGQTAPDVHREAPGAEVAQPPSTGAAPADDTLVPPLWLALVDIPQSVYSEYTPARESEYVNSGGVNFGLDVDLLTDYVYRGVDQTTVGLRSENALQFDAEAKFNLGKFPHPFIGLFVNVFNNDPVSRFEEVRPYFGAEWNLKPIIVAGGFNSYIHPNRKNLDTQEVFMSLTLDDSVIFHTPKPIFSPYIYGAYDFDLYNGFYLEAGAKHDFVFEDIGFTLTPKGDVAYVVDDSYFEKDPGVSGKNYGLQHYDVGLEMRVSLNHLFKVDKRYGTWSVKGYMYYTAMIDKDLRADTLLWGGLGLEFRY